MARRFESILILLESCGVEVYERKRIIIIDITTFIIPISYIP